MKKDLTKKIFFESKNVIQGNIRDTFDERQKTKSIMDELSINVFKKNIE